MSYRSGNNPVKTWNPFCLLPHTTMGAEGKSRQHPRKRPLAEPAEPQATRRAGDVTAVATESTAVSVSVHPPPAAKRVSRRQLDDGQRLPDAVASSSATDVPSSAVGSTPAIAAAMVHVCGHCQKRFRSPGKLAQHERVHTTASDVGCQSTATRHAGAHTGEKPYACFMCPRRFSDKGGVPRHERTHTSEKP